MSLFEDKKPDGFKTESPIRAFADFQTAGTVAIGKGFRPSLAHLAQYLGAMESKEGWRVVQVMLSQAGGDPTILFHRDSEHAVMPEISQREITFDDVDDYLRRMGFSLISLPDGELRVYRNYTTVPDLPFNPRAVESIVRERIKDPEEPDYTGRRYWRDRLTLAPDLGAPHDVPLLILVTSNFGKEYQASGLYKDGAWHIITNMEPLKHEATPRVPLGWRAKPSDEWTRADPDIRWVGEVEDELSLMQKRQPTFKHSVVHRAKAEMVTAAIEDDPINPEHYAGTACAEIGELLTGNSYQILKYNWRIGKKDDVLIEVGKSLWYLDREINLASAGRTAWLDASLPDKSFFEHRLHGRSEHTKFVARLLIAYNRNGDIDCLHQLRTRLMDQKTHIECGRGLAI